MAIVGSKMSKFILVILILTIVSIWYASGILWYEVAHGNDVVGAGLLGSITLVFPVFVIWGMWYLRKEFGWVSSDENRKTE